MASTRKLLILAELFKLKDMLVDQLNEIHARLEHNDQLLCRVRIKLEWVYHKDNFITQLEKAMQEFRDILREELEAELNAYAMSGGSSGVSRHNPESFTVTLESIPERVSEDDISVDHRFIQTGITEIDINNSILELWSIVEEMTRHGYIRQTSQTDEVSYSSISIDNPPPSNPPASLRKRLCRYFKISYTPEMLNLRIHLSYYPKSIYNWM
jgi:hypothetical protein